MREKKYYVLNVVIWLGVLAMVLALVFEIGAWVIRHWNLPGLP